MATAVGFIVVAVALLSFALVSARCERSIVSPAMVFVAVGVAVSDLGVGLVQIELDSHLVRLLAEITLTIILFTDASRIDFAKVRRQIRLPARLLGIGLPLSMILGALLVLPLVPALGVGGAFILAVILAPTDAALGQAVVTSPDVPLKVRQTINVESGLNDGIALPFLLLAVSVAGMQGDPNISEWLIFFVSQVGLGPIIGIAIGVAGAFLVERAYAYGWMEPVFLKLSSLALALLAFGAAEMVHGNGFIAAFAAGMTAGQVAPRACERLSEFGEVEGQLLSLITFFIFGIVLVPPAIAAFSWPILLYAVLSLTVVRMLPVAISLAGTGMSWHTKLFIGWFGPRGIASVLYVLLLLDENHLQRGSLVEVVATITVLLSILLHGVTAYPLARLYGRSEQATAPHMPEMEAVDPMPSRFGMIMSNLRKSPGVKAEDVRRAPD